MSMLSNNPRDYYFYIMGTIVEEGIPVVQALLVPKGQWESDGHGSGDSLNYAFTSKISKALGMNVAEKVEGVIGIWSKDNSIVREDHIKIELEKMGMKHNIDMAQYAKETAQYLKELGE